MTHDSKHSINSLVIEASRKTLQRIKAGLDREQLGACEPEPIVVVDWDAAGLSLGYEVEGDIGVDPIHALAASFPDTTFTLAFDYAAEDWSGFARWRYGAMVALESDDPTCPENHGELSREGILVASVGGGRGSTVLATSRWAAVCGLARRYGWTPAPGVPPAIEVPDGPVVRAHRCGHVELEGTVVPGDEARRLADALDLAICAYGLPSAIKRGLGIHGPAAAPSEAAGVDPLDPATPRVVRAVRDLARVGAELRVSRLLRRRPANE